MAVFGPFQDLIKVCSSSICLSLLWMKKKSVKLHSLNYVVFSMLFSDGLVRRFLRGEQGVYFDRPSPSYDEKDFVPIEVKAGSLVVIHGDLVHQR